jgi:hypothetical protein
MVLLHARLFLLLSAGGRVVERAGGGGGVGAALHAPEERGGRLGGVDYRAAAVRCEARSWVKEPVLDWKVPACEWRAPVFD